MNSTSIIITVGLSILVLGLIMSAFRQVKSSEGFATGLPSTPGKFDCQIDQKIMRQGLDYFKTQRLVICALLRDSEASLNLIERQAEAVGSLFRDYAVVVVENDSHDGTRTRLLEWAKRNHHITVLGCGINMLHCSLEMAPTLIHDRDVARIDKMVRLRNTYLDHIRSDSFLSRFDLALLWDMDIRGSIYLDGLGSSGYYMKQGIDGVVPDAMCANGIADIQSDRVELGKYYDPYAHEDIGQVRIFTTVDDIQPPTCNRPPYQVRSCFNGFTFYRLPALTAKRYNLQPEGQREAICEHVTIHRGMKVFLNPSMLYLMDYHDSDHWDVMIDL